MVPLWRLQPLKTGRLAAQYCGIRPETVYEALNTPKYSTSGKRIRKPLESATKKRIRRCLIFAYNSKEPRLKHQYRILYNHQGKPQRS